MTRDPSRIPKILDAIKEIWQHCSDLRLGQLLLNVLRDPALYYVEDAELVKKLREHYAPRTADLHLSNDVSSRKGIAVKKVKLTAKGKEMLEKLEEKLQKSDDKDL